MSSKKKSSTKGAKKSADKKQARVKTEAVSPQQPTKEQQTPAKDKPMSCLDAAAAVLKAKGEPMKCKEMIDAMFARKLWHTDAPTPAATLSSAILRELKKGAESRFKKTGRGMFGLNG